MKRSSENLLSALLVFAGATLIVMGAANGRLRAEESRYLVFLTLAGWCAATAVVGGLAWRFADEGYRSVLANAVLLACSGLAALAVFFGFSGLLFGARASGILMGVMLPCYGIAMILAGCFNHLLRQQAYRPFIFDLFRQVPSLYYRYRT